MTKIYKKLLTKILKYLSFVLSVIGIFLVLFMFGNYIIHIAEIIKKYSDNIETNN